MKGYFDEMAEHYLEKGIAEGKSEGKAEGFAEGETIAKNKLALLMNKLFALNRVDDLKKASVDLEFLNKLMKEFAID